MEFSHYPICQMAYRRVASKGKRRYNRRYAPTVRRRAPVRRRAVSRRSRRYPTVDKCKCPGELSPSEKFVLANIDPFEPRCLGAKIPDSSTIPSLSICDIENQDLTLTTTTNSKCYAFMPQYTSGIVAATDGAGSWSWQALYAGATNRSKRSSYTTAYELDRPVAHAIRLVSQVAPTSATGFVHVAIAFESNYLQTSWPWPTTTATMSGYPFYKRVTLASLTQSPLTIINKFTDETAFRYSSSGSGNATSGTLQGTDNTFQVARNWGTILIAFEGVGSAAPLSVEHLLITEATPNVSGAVSGTTAAPGNNNILNGVGHMSANTDFTHTETTQNSYMSQALGAFTQAAADQTSEYVSNLAANFGANAGRAATTLAFNMLARGMSPNNGLPGINNENRLT